MVALLPLIFCAPAVVEFEVEFVDDLFAVVVFVLEFAAEFDAMFEIELVVEVDIEFVVFDTFVVDMFETLLFVLVMRLALLFELFVAEPPQANANPDTKMIKPVYNFIKHLPIL